MDEKPKTIFDWSYFFVYLSGAIDMADDRGNGWRDDWTKRLIDIGMKPHQILNPCKKPLHETDISLDNEGELMDKYRSRKEWKNLCDVMDKIAHIDLRMCDLAGLILVNMPKARIDGKIQNHQVPTYGTIHEIVVARLQRKPVMMVWEGGKEECSGWLMWLIGHQNVFNNVDELMVRLENIAKGKTSYNPKDWLFFDLEKNEKHLENPEKVV